VSASRKQKTAQSEELAENDQTAGQTGQAILVAEGLSPERVINLALDFGVHHVIQKNSMRFSQELEAAKTMSFQPKEFFANPIQVILGKEKMKLAQSCLISCEAGDRKETVLGQMDRFLQAKPETRGIRDDIRAAADELFTNSSKNTGNFYLKLQGGAPQDHRPGRVELLISFDDERLVLGCIDSFGDLQTTSVLKRIYGVIQNGVGESIKMGAGGAGIGSYMIFNSCISLYMGVKRNQSTMVFCVFPLSKKHVELSSLPKNIHILSYESDEEST
jgi:hypothetical protein